MSQIPACSREFLPENLLQILERKSSRDPSSRFENKLFILLNFVYEHPELENTIGAAWIDDHEFRLNKKVVSNILGIKINTLNVNLKDLKFNRRASEQNGWTIWKKVGFSKTGCSFETSIMQNQKFEPQPPPDAKCNIGRLTPLEVKNFETTVLNAWAEISGSSNMLSMEYNMFIEKAARRLKQVQQTLENSIEVLKAILQCKCDKITYFEYFKFLAMFGPEDSAMVKIASLLKYSNATGNWLNLHVELQQSVHHQTPVGFFDANEPNKLVYKHQSFTIVSWNNPLIPSSQPYVIDEYDTRFKAWDDMFTHKLQTHQQYPSILEQFHFLSA